MCGIAGMLSLNGKPVLPEEVQAMCLTLAHRGPDDEGFYVRPEIGMGMRRLSIIDLQTGSQPVRNEDGSVWVVFNGEIYNFKDLRAELESRGHRFYTSTDTEAIVHLYEDYGAACPEKLRGMFAFAVWDERRRSLLLARDRLGIKPLYYAEADGRLLFASELKAILRLDDVERRVSWRAVNHLFTSLHTPPDQSIIEGVRKLEPAHVLTASSRGSLRVRRYWDVQFNPNYTRSAAQTIARLRDELEESVQLHLVSDVPLGAFLSGGIDSSAVVASAAARIGPEPLKTFSVGFSEAEYDELEYARQIARQFRTDHHELILQPNVLDALDDLAWYLDEPFGDSSAIPTYMVSKLASEHVTVVLSGDGGDELFAGYDKYRVEGRERTTRFLPGAARRLLGMLGSAVPAGKRGHNFLRHFSLQGFERYLDALTLFRREQRQRLFQPDVWRLVSELDPHEAVPNRLEQIDGHWLTPLQYWDLKNYLPLDILTKVDRMSMAHSVEARVPLLDHKFIEFALTIPPELNLKNGSGKLVFKQALRGILPDSVIDRPKHGFAVPLGTWFRGRLGAYVRETLLSSRSRSRGILNLDYVETLLKHHEQGRRLDFQLWTLISLELWCRTFLDRKGSAASAPARVVAQETSRHAA